MSVCDTTVQQLHPDEWRTEALNTPSLDHPGATIRAVPRGGEATQADCLHLASVLPEMAGATCMGDAP